MKLKEVRRSPIIPEVALYISDFLEIPAMKNLAKALALKRTFKRKIRYAEFMHAYLIRSHILDSYMIRTLSESDYKLTFSVMRRLFTYLRSKHSVHVSCSCQNNETGDFDGQVAYLMTERIFRDEIRPADYFYYYICVKGDMETEVYRCEIDEWVMPLTKEMFEMIEDTTTFLFYSDTDRRGVSKKCARLFQHLLAAIPKDKRLIICCFNARHESTLTTLMHHLHLYKQLLDGGEVPRNVEFHAIHALKFDNAQFIDNIRRVFYDLVLGCCRYCGYSR